MTVKLEKELAAGLVVLGGCVVGPADPEWLCTGCGTHIYTLDCSNLIPTPTAQFPAGKKRPSQASMERLMDKISREILAELAKER